MLITSSRVLIFPYVQGMTPEPSSSIRKHKALKVRIVYPVIGLGFRV